MADDFYPFVENDPDSDGADIVRPLTSARIAVYDDMSMPPRVVMVEPSDVRTFLAEITKTTYDLAFQYCEEWSFQVIRELVENLIHASFMEPTISILDRGKTIVFCDQGPGIANKQAALKPSFSSATAGMKRYIRGVGSGLPIVEEWLRLHHGSLAIEDNLGRGTTVTVSLLQKDEPSQTRNANGGNVTVVDHPPVPQPYIPVWSNPVGGYHVPPAGLPFLGYGRPFYGMDPVAAAYWPGAALQDAYPYAGGRPVPATGAWPTTFQQMGYGVPATMPYGGYVQPGYQNPGYIPPSQANPYAAYQATPSSAGDAYPGRGAPNPWGKTGAEARQGTREQKDSYQRQPADKSFGAERTTYIQSVRPTAVPTASPHGSKMFGTTGYDRPYGRVAPQRMAAASADNLRENGEVRDSYRPDDAYPHGVAPNACRRPAEFGGASAAAGQTYPGGTQPQSAPNPHAPSYTVPTREDDGDHPSLHGNHETDAASVKRGAAEPRAALTGDQRDVMLLFAKNEKVGPKELGDQLGIPAATGSRKLRDLSTAGYIVKKGQKYILTGEGRRVLAHLTNSED